ncbi:MAG: hypothetical protein UU89_C0024G0020 [Parcubacteria group bacterium GW2011_GWC2_42_11]|nr:MAG: hypothetical protein UU89_C0024G0020 [Parcubacteria group bacterium GW2011_GWC2_42_11]
MLGTGHAFFNSALATRLTSWQQASSTPLQASLHLAS